MESGKLKMKNASSSPLRPHFPFFTSHSSFSILHFPFFILHSPLPILPHGTDTGGSLTCPSQFPINGTSPGAP